MATAPTASQEKHLDVIGFEYRCRQYLHQRGLQEIAKTQADALKPLIMADVEKFGLVPTNAEKSRRVDGRDFVATLTTGDGIEVNDAAALELEILLSKARQSKLFPQLFSRRTEYSLAAGASQVIEHTKWPQRFAEEIRNLYAKCFTANKRTPVLKVERRADVEARERAAASKTGSKVKKAAGLVAALLITAGVLGCAKQQQELPASAVAPRPYLEALDSKDGEFDFEIRVSCPTGWTPQEPQRHTSQGGIGTAIERALASSCAEASAGESSTRTLLIGLPNGSKVLGETL